MKTRKLTQAELRRVLCYNPLSGNFMWRISPSNKTPVGSIAGSISCGRNGNGLLYRRIQIHERGYPASHLAILYIKGRWPIDEIDHINGNSLNNRFLNLRMCTSSQNSANRGPQKNNKLGIKGVYRTPRGRYRAQIGKDGQVIKLGHYNTSKSAALAYRKAAKKYFGEFAKWN
ncbi:hypothetical protein LCGC14_1629400 [marine sediment metagenome]|uniref:AP2/ERF domain-containing protein n=1 Tax=marine sediment metagenome TaxID=412755 RepID=A0A0F9KIS8_9ZZZZ